MNIGLVLSGGFAKGAYQIGALKAIGEFIPNEDIKYISASSIGVLNGYAFETGKLDKAEALWKSVNSGNANIYMNQLLKSNIMQQNILDIFDAECAISKNFYATLFNLSHKNVIYKDLSSVDRAQIPTYLKASIAMPIYNRSVAIDGISYFDGGIVDNIPVFPLLKHKLDYMICIYFDDTCYKFENTYFDNKIIKIAFPSQGLLKQSLIVNSESIDEMLENGYKKTKYLLSCILSGGHENLDYIYDAITFFNQGNDPKPRITTDVLITNLNSITQRLTKRKIL